VQVPVEYPLWSSRRSYSPQWRSAPGRHRSANDTSHVTVVVVVSAGTRYIKISSICRIVNHHCWTSSLYHATLRLRSQESKTLRSKLYVLRTSLASAGSFGDRTAKQPTVLGAWAEFFHHGTAPKRHRTGLDLRRREVGVIPRGKHFACHSRSMETVQRDQIFKYKSVRKRNMWWTYE
jgi:hypothetical protein